MSLSRIASRLLLLVLMRDFRLRWCLHLLRAVEDAMGFFGDSLGIPSCSLRTFDPAHFQATSGPLPVVLLHFLFPDEGGGGEEGGRKEGKILEGFFLPKLAVEPELALPLPIPPRLPWLEEEGELQRKLCGRLPEILLRDCLEWRSKLCPSVAIFRRQLDFVKFRCFLSSFFHDLIEFRHQQKRNGISEDSL